MRHLNDPILVVSRHIVNSILWIIYDCTQIPWTSNNINNNINALMIDMPSNDITPLDALVILFRSFFRSNSRRAF